MSGYQEELAKALRSNMQQANLVSLRGQADPLDNQMLAPMEHQQFARQAVQENPLMALPIAAATPFYYAAKQPAALKLAQALGLVGPGATPATIDQVFGGLRGVGQGLGLMKD